MTREELIERLKGYEWNDIEFKRAQRGVPVSAYETVSAFSNTEGGWLVYGVLDRNGNYEIVGVIEVDKVQNDFLSALRADNKVNHDIQVEAKLIEAEGQTVLAFHIPEASRQNKPIYLISGVLLSVAVVVISIALCLKSNDFCGMPQMNAGMGRFSISRRRKHLIKSRSSGTEHCSTKEIPVTMNRSAIRNFSTSGVT